MKNIKWPGGKRFAFTIVDDTDLATTKNIENTYEYLYKKGIITTKTVWAYKSRDTFTGDCVCENKAYADFIKKLAERGFEIAYHGAGSGNFTGDETARGLDEIEDITGASVRVHINHSHNYDGMYWGATRFCRPFAVLYSLYRKLKKCPPSTFGHVASSEYFWGEVCKKKIDYIRNRVYGPLNVLTRDKHMPYMEHSKEKYTNYWFSASDAMDYNMFVHLMSKENVDRLVREGGLAVLYVHFAFDFTDKDGQPRQGFKDAIDYVASQNGYFAPVSEILDFLKTQQGRGGYIGSFSKLKMDLTWLFDRVMKKLLFKQ